MNPQIQDFGVPDQFLAAEKMERAKNYLKARCYPSGDAEILKISADCLGRRPGRGGAKRKNTSREEMDEETLNKSKQRARSNLRRKVLTMQADRLLTLTFRANVTDKDEAGQCFKYFNSLMREKYGESYVFVCVAERQKRGAIHFHLAINRRFEVNIVRGLWRRACGDRSGNIDITPPRNTGDGRTDSSRIASYIAKYISKGDVSTFNGKRFTSSRNIKVPEPITGWMPSLEPSHIHSIIQKIFSRIAKFSASYIWESDDYRRIIYITT